MDVTRLEELKQKLLHEKTLRNIWVFFLDHFGENKEFMSLGERVQHPLIEAIVEQVCPRMFVGDTEITNLVLLGIPNSKLIHGAFCVGKRVGGVIFFEDTQMGLLMVADTPPSIEVRYGRFSGRPMRKPPEPSDN